MVKKKKTDQISNNTNDSKGLSSKSLIQSIMKWQQANTVIGGYA